MLCFSSTVLSSLMQNIPFSFLLFPLRPAFHPWSCRHPRGSLPVRTRRLWRWGGGSRTANRSSSWRLDAKMEPFVHELVYSGASGERECFFLLFFVFVFLALPWIFVIEQETFHLLCGGKPWLSSGRRSGEIPSSLPLCSAHSSKVPHSRLSWAAVYPTYDFGSWFRHFDNQMRGTLWHWITFAALCVQVWDISI